MTQIKVKTELNLGLLLDTIRLAMDSMTWSEAMAMPLVQLTVLDLLIITKSSEMLATIVMGMYFTTLLCMNILNSLSTVLSKIENVILFSSIVLLIIR